MTDRIQQALEKAREELSQFNRKYFPNVTAEREAALAVVEAASEVGGDNVYLTPLQDALHAWADAILEDKP
jgi:hypothetical protein